MKIGMCGTISIGKTTLVKELSKLDKFKDYSVIIERTKYLKDLGIPVNKKSSLEGQTIFLSERVKEILNPNVLTDRTVIDVMAFTLTSPIIPHFQADKFCELASQFLSEYDYIFYIDTKDTILEDNGVRIVDEEYRKIIDKTIQELIDQYSNKTIFHTLSGTTEQRIKQILYYIN